MPRFVYKNRKTIDPDEIFLDAKNLPSFSTEQLEGQISQGIDNKIFLKTIIVFIICALILGGRIGYLTIVRGEVLRERSIVNHIQTDSIPASRGIIYDRFGNKLVDNTASDYYIQRAYTSDMGLSHLIGYLSSEGNGVSGLEQTFNDHLQGQAGQHFVEVDFEGNVISQGTLENPKAGKSLETTLWLELQKKLYSRISNLARDRGFRGGAGIILDPRSGEILAFVSFPDFQSSQFSSSEYFQKTLLDPTKPFFNRPISGLYSPGSIVKPFLALAALEENIIDPSRAVLSTGSLTVPNPFNPNQPSIFPDWKAHGWVDMRRALAVSSNVYFFTIGGGFGDIRGLGVESIKKYLQEFGFGAKTNIEIEGEEKGFIPDPETKKITHPENTIWRIGDTYNLSIGQGDILITPLQAARAVSILANDGYWVQPHLIRQSIPDEKSKLSFNSANIEVVKEGMRLAVLEGTAQALSGLPIKVAAKTGTAQTGDTRRVNSWVIGFAPVEDPEIAFAIVLESGSIDNLVGAPLAAREMISWYADNRTVYLESRKEPASLYTGF